MGMNPYMLPGGKTTIESTRAGIQYEIDTHTLSDTVKYLSDDVRELKKMMKLLQKPDQKILKQYSSLRDLYDQYRETYIIIFGKDLNE